MKRIAFLLGAVSATAVYPAFADDLIITTETTDPVKTSEAANATPGDITVSDTGSVVVEALEIPDGEEFPPAAVTLDSDNSVTNSGSIVHRGLDHPLGVRIVGGTSGNFTNAGSILVEGVTASMSTTDATGVLLDSGGTFTGDIVTTGGSEITAWGPDAAGMLLRSEVMGNVLLDGEITGIGDDADGVVVFAPITGMFVNGGSIRTEPEDEGTTEPPASPR